MNDKLTINDYISYQNESAQSDDVYDFSNNSEEHVLQRRYIEDPNYNYTDEDEEDDINFDYEYGYDYERVIKDRLRKVNQDFVNDSEPSNRKTILVSFDNAVTAIDISLEEQEKIQKENFVNSEEKQKFKAALEHTQQTEDNVVKVPLNDIIQKTDPDAFANQVRIKNSLYDAQVQQQQLEVDKHTNKFYELNEHDDSKQRASMANSSGQQQIQIKSVKLSSVNIIEKNSNTTSQQQQQQTVDLSRHSSSPTLDDRTNENHAKISTAYRSSTPSPPPQIDSPEPKAQTTNTQTAKTKMKKSKKTATITESPPITILTVQANSEYDNSDWTESSQTRCEEKDSFENQKARINDNNSRLISFSSRDNIQSPSPILSSHSTDQASGSRKTKNKSQSDKILLTNMSPSKEGDESLVLNSDRIVEEENSSERILVEKDGVFKLMTTEEHTAYEEQKKKEANLNRHVNKKSNSLNNSTFSSSTITSQKQSPSAASSAAVKISLPVSVQRRAGNSNKAVSASSKTRPKSSIISREHSSAFATRLEERLSQGHTMGSINNIDIERTHVRLSHSADPKSRAHHVNNKGANWRTPDYASDYKSPYQMVNKIVKVGETAEEKRQREQEKEDRKRINELAFKAWLKQKETQKHLDTKIQKKNKTNNEESQSTANGTITTTINTDDRVSFDAWLLKKKKQLDYEKEYKKTINSYAISDHARMKTPEERSKAFKEWLNKKTKEKLDAVKQEKLELKKWTTKRRRSRKHQRLSQALELAQAYGYNSPYRSPGGPFNF